MGDITRVFLNWVAGREPEPPEPDDGDYFRDVCWIAVIMLAILVAVEVWR